MNLWSSGDAGQRYFRCVDLNPCTEEEYVANEEDADEQKRIHFEIVSRLCLYKTVHAATTTCRTSYVTSMTQQQPVRLSCRDLVCLLTVLQALLSRDLQYCISQNMLFVAVSSECLHAHIFLSHFVLILALTLLCGVTGAVSGKYVAFLRVGQLDALFLRQGLLEALRPGGRDRRAKGKFL
jgi:hypothetical protein